MRSWVISSCALGFVLMHDVLAADIAAGKRVADQQCVQCHDAGDWQGEDAASLASLIRDIMAGKIKHRQPLRVSQSDIDNIAAYWAQSGK